MTQGMAQTLLVRIAAALAFSVGLTLANICAASTLQVSVVDAQGKPVTDVVITATVNDAARIASPPMATAIMDQVNKEFVPEVIVVQTGTTVSFPNSDSVAHQVYSFSAAKRFSLPLYRGKPYPPVVFDQAGVVTLGCNIHDHMVGYVVVTETPYFGQTNAQGQWSRELPQGAYRIRAWHPRLNEQLAEQSVTLVDAGAASATFMLTKSLRPAPHSPTDKRLRDY
jgi:plastocyanin